MNIPITGTAALLDLLSPYIPDAEIQEALPRRRAGWSALPGSNIPWGRSSRNSANFGSGLPMRLALQQAGLPISVVKGAQVRHFGLCEGRQAKNGPADAKLIARFAKARQLSADPPLRRAQLALAEMVALRRQLVDLALWHLSPAGRLRSFGDRYRMLPG